MKRAFLALALSDLILMIVTSGVGLALSNTPRTAIDDQTRYFTVHFLLGLLTALFTCFVQVATFMYFAVCYKIIQQSVLAGGTDADTAHRYVLLKSRALRAAAAGIVSILVAVGLGAAINVYVSPQSHLIAAFACIAVTAAIYVYLYTLIHESTQLFQLIGEAEPERLTAEPAGTHGR